MKVIDKTINVWQAGIILFVMLFANKILVLPALLYDGAKMNAFFVPIFLFMFEIALLFVFYLVKKRFPNENFATILRQHCGKYVQIAVYVLILLFFISKAVLLYNVTFIFFRNMIYNESDSFIFLFCFIPIISHMAMCGLRVIGRTFQLFFPLILFITIFCVLVGFFGVTEIPLLFDAPASDVFFTALRHFSCFGDTLFLFVIMDKVEVKKGQWKILFSFSVAAAIIVTTVITLFLFSYTYTSFMHPYAIFEIMSYIKEYGGVGRIDIISMILIIVLAYFHLALYLKFFMLTFHKIFKNVSPIISVLSFDAIFIVIVNFFIINLETAVVYGQNLVPFLEVIPFVIVPILSFVCLYLSRRRRRK